MAYNRILNLKSIAQIQKRKRSERTEEDNQITQAKTINYIKENLNFQTLLHQPYATYPASYKNNFTLSCFPTNQTPKPLPFTKTH